MKLIEKIKQYGVRKSLKILSGKIVNRINELFYLLFLILPMDSKLISFESEGDMSDNAYALYHYLMQNQYLKGYTIVWFIDGDTKLFEQKISDIIFLKKYPTFIDPVRSRILARMKYFIFDHCNIYDNLRKRKGFKSIYLTHGCTFKKSTADESYMNNADEVYYTGKLYSYPMRDFCRCSENVMYDIGYPRNDYLFGEITNEQMSFCRKYSFSEYKKIVLWMPTFRRSKNTELSEDYFDSHTGLPILEEENDLNSFDEILSKENMLCIFKIHHLQAELPAFRTSFSNILIINDEDLRSENIQLYQMVRLTDFLITDYSSIGNDYMLMDKPIIYTLDDYEQYRDSRGFSVDDPAQYFIGYHVKDKAHLYEAVIDAGNGIDKYRRERNELLPFAHTYNDGNSGRRIAQRLGFEK